MQGIYLEITDILNCSVLSNAELGRVIRYLVDKEFGDKVDLSNEPKHVQLAYKFLEYSEPKKDEVY